jgi:hypothetical protein
MNQIIIKMILITWKKNQFSLKNQTKMKQEKKFNFINYLKIYIYIYIVIKRRGSTMKIKQIEKLVWNSKVLCTKTEIEREKKTNTLCASVEKRRCRDKSNHIKKARL